MGLRRHRDRIRFVLVHHEEAAAFMATGYAKATGRLGVCLATSGPGGIHLLNGLYDAKLDHQPVLALTGMQETEVLGTAYQQEVHLDRLFDDVAGFNAMVHVPPQIPSLVDRAVRSSLANRTVSHITFPNDLQVAAADAHPWRAVAPARMPQTAPVYLGPSGLPDPAACERGATLLNEGSRVVMLHRLHPVQGQDRPAQVVRTRPMSPLQDGAGRRALHLAEVLRLAMATPASDRAWPAPR